MRAVMKTANPLVRIVFGVALFTATTLPSSTAMPDMTAPADDCLPKYPPPPVLKIKVRVPACSEPGQAIEYRICVENCSTAEAHHVMVKNLIPSNAKYVKADPLPSLKGDELQWQLGTIGGGAVREIVLLLLPTNKEDVKNCARVQFEHGQCVVTRQAGFRPGPGAQPPIIIGEPPKPSKVEVVPDAKDLPELELTVRGPKEQYANLAAKYVITLTNKGKITAAGILVRSSGPAQMKLVQASDPGEIVNNEAGWPVGTLEPGASKNLELTVRATDKGEYCLKTTLKANRLAEKVQETCTTFVSVSAMSIEMYDTVDPVFVGGKTTYPVIVKAVGSEAVTNVRLKAFVPDGLKFEKANGAVESRAIVQGGEWIEFPVLPKIEAGYQRNYELTVVAVGQGYARFHVQITADQLDPGRPVVEQESTTVVDDRK
jgi:uncharacterized repeat protein (TIGR01451 family)